jgi:isocitrate dehydrogenase
MLKTPVTVARGDGIGPEIMDATLAILEAAGAQIEPEFIEIGKKVYESGNSTGVSEEAWESLRRTGIFLKAPLTTPQGGGYKSVNVTLRKSFGLFSNVRPVRTYRPFVNSKHNDIDMVIVRENEEDLYAGMEYRQTHDACHSLKVLSRAGSELICRYAFEYARANGRKKVTCLVKDNIMKISDGLFHKVFDLISQDFPEIEAEALIVDIGMALVADRPEDFDVVVTLNLYGDIVSDIASQIAGSVGLAGSMNIGHHCAMFEAVHGSAPDIAGKGIANPSGLLNGAILMLHHIGQSDVAVNIENAWLYTLENGQHTGDIATDKSKALTTKEFGDAVIQNLGKAPSSLKKACAEDYRQMKMPTHEERTLSARVKTLVGVDVFVEWEGGSPKELGEKLSAATPDGLDFTLLANRGMKVYPMVNDDQEIVGDSWCCRFRGANGVADNKTIETLLASISNAGVDWVKVENLYNFDGERGFSLLQGE